MPLSKEGGPTSEYGSGRFLGPGGYKIIPRTGEEASAWVLEHLGVDAYEDIFGEVDEFLETIVLSYAMPAVVADLVKRAAAAEGKSESAIVIELIRKEYGAEDLPEA